MAKLDNMLYWTLKNFASSEPEDIARRERDLKAYLEQSKFKEDERAGYLLAMINTKLESMPEIPVNLKPMITPTDALPHHFTYLTEKQRQFCEQLKTLSRNSAKLAAKGISVPLTILLTGKPGTGKTLFAQKLAKELELPFFYVSIPSVVDSLLGKTGTNILSLFDYASKGKCIMMLDELDAVGSFRTDRGSSVHREENRTSISIMLGLDRLKAGNIIIAATNREEAIDKAILRRFRITYQFDDMPVEDAYQMLINYLEHFQIAYKDCNLEEFKDLANTDALNPSRLINALELKILLTYPNKIAITDLLEEI